MPAKRKENVPPKGSKKRARSANEEEESPATKKQRVEKETASEEATTVRRTASGRVRKPPQRYAEETLAAPGPRTRGKSSKEQTTKQKNGKAQPKNQKAPAGNAKKPQARGGKGKKSAAPEVEAGIYEVPESADELQTLPTTKKKRGAKAATKMPSKTAPPAPVEATRRGKKRGAQAALEDPSDSDSPAAVEEGSPPAKKRRGPPPTSQALSNDVGGEIATASPTPEAKTSEEQPAEAHTSQESETENEPNDSDVSQVRGRKDLISEADKPGAIVTPSKRDGAGRARKDVVISDMQNGEDADDLEAPESPSASIRRNQKRPAEEAEVEPESQSTNVEQEEGREQEIETTQTELQQEGGEQEVVTQSQEEDGEEDSQRESQEDDEVCRLCSKPDSKRGNMIIFCDGCDMPVHQRCYGVAKIPKGDWFCRNCLERKVDSADQAEAAEDPMEGLATTTTSTGQAAEEPMEGLATTTTYQPAEETMENVTTTEDIPDIPNFERHLNAMKRVLLDRCSGSRRLQLRNLDGQYDAIYQVVEQTVAAGESNSMMVIGARGSGKTVLMDTVLNDISKAHKNKFHVVRLNGLIHTDDKIAMRQIWRELGQEMGVDEDLINQTRTYADTMASLLALLSHPAEIADGTQENVTSNSVVFVIEETDLFTHHPRQTLLYNLFDIAQAKKAPIAVICMSTRIDVVECLEKRVKSRFSHRNVYLPLPRSLPEYWDICRQALTIDDEDMKSEGINQNLEGHSRFWKWWNEKIETLYKTRGFQERLMYHYYTTKSVARFVRGWAIPIALLREKFPGLRPPGPNHGHDMPDNKLHLVECLSDLDLAMLIAAARLEIVAGIDTVNFKMAYKEYIDLMTRQRATSAGSGMMAHGGARVWGRGIALMAWERLANMDLLVPANSGHRLMVGNGAGGLNQGGIENRMWKVDIAVEEIPQTTKLNAVLAKWCREIIAVM